MKLVGVFGFVFCLVIDVNSASVSLSSNQLTLDGNAHIRFYGPREEIWNGLSDGKTLWFTAFYFTAQILSRRWYLLITNRTARETAIKTKEKINRNGDVVNLLENVEFLTCLRVIMSWIIQYCECLTAKWKALLVSSNSASPLFTPKVQ